MRQLRRAASPRPSPASVRRRRWSQRSRGSAVLRHQELENLDVAAVRGPNRLLTRAIASWLYSRTDAHGQPLYAGIRYVSRLGDSECWTIFGGTPVQLRATHDPEPTNRSLRAILDLFGMVIR